MTKYGTANIELLYSFYNYNSKSYKTSKHISFSVVLIGIITFPYLGSKSVYSATENELYEFSFNCAIGTYKVFLLLELKTRLGLSVSHR